MTTWKWYLFYQEITVAFFITHSGTRVAKWAEFPAGLYTFDSGMIFIIRVALRYVLVHGASQG
jgi:hypothetical protein